MRITTAKELINAALDANAVPVKVSAALLEGAVDILEKEEFDAGQAGGAEMVRRLGAVRAAAGRLSSVETDGTERASVAQAAMAGIASYNSDEHMLWLLASSIMTDEQMAFVRNAFQ